MIHAKPSRFFVPAWTMGRIAAAGALITLSGLGGIWNLSRVANEPRVLSAEAQAAVSRAAVERLERENKQLREKSAASPAAVGTSVSPVIQLDSRKFEELSRELTATQGSEASARQAFTADEAKIAQFDARVAELESQNADKAMQIAALAPRLEETERRYTETVAELGRAKSGRDEQVSQLSTALGRIRELEGQVSQMRNVLDGQQRKLDQSLRMTAMMQSPGASLIRLRATEAGQSASGVALFTDRDRLVFFASNLPALAPGRTYQLWLIRDRGPAVVSAGTFSRSGKDAPALQLTDSKLITGVRGVAVTEEPAGGSPSRLDTSY